MGNFKWTASRQKAALALALGYTVAEVAEQSGVTERAVYNWKSNTEFMTEVDKLTLMSGIALRAERLRIAMRVVRQKVKEERVATNRDVLDWLKYAQGETDGFKLDFAAFLAAGDAVDGEQPGDQECQE
jgi:predicted transcriptional regulator